HPVMLAKEAATLDLLSGGRLELGVGAGWLRDAYERAGMPFDPAGVPVGRLEESLRLLEGLLAGSAVTLSGAHCTPAGPAPCPRRPSGSRPGTAGPVSTRRGSSRCRRCSPARPAASPRRCRRGASVSASPTTSFPTGTWRRSRPSWSASRAAEAARPHAPPTR